MGSFSIWHWLIVGIVVMLLFGKGRFSDMMGDVAKGIKSFKKGMAEEDEQPKPAQRLQAQPPMEPADPGVKLQEMPNDRPGA
jgi:sec-independent protein translocase protein TatA